MRRPIGADVTGEPGRDALTNLPNRLLFADRVRDEARVEPTHAHAVLVLKVGGLPDPDGTRRRDLLLVEIAGRLRRAMRPSDVVARSAKDEFAIWLEHCDGLDASAAAGRLHEDLGVPFESEGAIVFPEVSMGIALFPAHSANTSELLRLAQRAADDAKRAGAACVVFQPRTRGVRRAPASQVADRVPSQGSEA